MYSKFSEKLKRMAAVSAFEVFKIFPSFTPPLSTLQVVNLHPSQHQLRSLLLLGPSAIQSPVSADIR
jgi:hypothetical protein